MSSAIKIMKFGLATDSIFTSELIPEQAKKIDKKLNFTCFFILFYLKIMIEFNLVSNYPKYSSSNVAHIPKVKTIITIIHFCFSLLSIFKSTKKQVAIKLNFNSFASYKLSIKKLIIIWGCSSAG